MRCEGCGAGVFDGDVACSDCGRELPETPRRAEPLVAAVAVDAFRFETEVALEVPADAPRCAEHLDQLAPHTCKRCGRYCCAACLPAQREEPHCPSCQRRLKVEQNPAQLASVRRELTVSFFFGALVIGGLGLALPALVGSNRIEWYALGTLFLLAQLGTATGFLVLPRAALAWLAVAVELIASLSLMAAVGVSLITSVLLVFPLLTVVRVFKWQSLRAEAASLTASATPPG